MKSKKATWAPSSFRDKARVQQRGHMKSKKAAWAEFIERQRGDHNPSKVAGFKSKERLLSSEIKENCLRFILRVSEELYLNIYWILNINLNI